MIVVYSSVRVPAGLRPEGAKFINASFFTAPEPGATLVYTYGTFDKINRAYAAFGVAVADLRSRTAPVATLAAPNALPALADLPEAEQAEVESVLNDDAPFEGVADTDQS